VTNPALGKLDYIYTPSTDVAGDAHWFVEALGAELVFAIDRSGTRVAMLRVGHDGPAIVLTDHLPDDRSILLYRVADLAATEADLTARGWSAGRTLELPMGGCTTFQAPAGARLAIYELSRPGVVESMAGQLDF
jgi:hypothetical protein